MKQIRKLKHSFAALSLIGIVTLVNPVACYGQGYTISTVAGSGTYGPLGDGGPATSAYLSSPYSVAVDATGNLFIADSSKNVIRKVSPGGTISTIAGDASQYGGYSGDGGPAVDAQLHTPWAVSVDAVGNLYIADFSNGRVRKVDTKGTITTVAGGGSSTLDGPGILSVLASPVGLAVDAAGNLFIADSSSLRVLKLRPDGTMMTYLDFMAVSAVAVDSGGNLYFVRGDLVNKVSPNGTVSKIAGTAAEGYFGDGGPATNAALNSPKGVAVDSSGNVYIADTTNQRVRMISTDGTITTIAGNGAVGYTGDGGPATSARLNNPIGVAVDSSNRIYIVDQGNGRIRMLTGAPSSSVPVIKSGGVVSAGAFGAFSSVAPGSWIEVYGTNLASTSRSWGGGDFNGANAPTSLDGTSVTIGGQKAFIDYISPTQVNAQVPSTVGTGTQQVIVTTAAGASAAFSITVNSEQPGLLAPSSFTVAGKQYVTALFADGATFVLPPGSIAGLNSRRTQPGDVITLYGIGFGAVTPAIGAGQVVQQSNSLVAPLHILFGQTEATVSYAGLAPNAVGLYQFNVVVPNVSSSDSIPLTFTLAGVSGKQTLYIAVQNGALAPQVQNVTVGSASVTGGGSVQGTVVLTSSAPAGGAIVSLSSNSLYATVPSTVTVPAGSASATFSIATSSPSSNQSVTITASYSGSSAQAALTVTPSTSTGGTSAFSQLTATFNYQPVGTFSGSSILQMTADAGNTYTAVAGGVTFIKGTASNQGQTFTFNTIALGASSRILFIFGSNYFLTTAGSLTFTVNQTSSIASYASGKIAGTLTLTGSWDGISQVTISGAITGTYSASLQ